MNVVDQIKVMQTELRALKSADGARPTFITGVQTGMYQIPILSRGHGVEVTCTSSTADFPFFTFGTYDQANKNVIDCLPCVRENPGTLGTVNKFMVYTGATAVVLTLRWSVMSQSVKTVAFQVVTL